MGADASLKPPGEHTQGDIGEARAEVSGDTPSLATAEMQTVHASYTCAESHKAKQVVLQMLSEKHFLAMEQGCIPLCISCDNAAVVNW